MDSNSKEQQTESDDPSELIAVRIPRTLAQRLRRHKQATHVPMAATIRLAIEAFLALREAP